MPYPPIPRDESGAPFPVVWDAQIKNWRIYEGTKVLYGPNGEPMFTVQNPGVVKVDDANPVKVQLSGTIVVETVGDLPSTGYMAQVALVSEGRRVFIYDGNEWGEW